MGYFEEDYTDLEIFGTYGEFQVKGESAADGGVKARYFLTKVKPAGKGREALLAKNLRPWREIFSSKEMNFDEMLQRDLDDSRVAHDLIPYLLGDKGNYARFFPPILAILTPKKNSDGIYDFYPKPKDKFESNNDLKQEYYDFGDLFKLSSFEMQTDRGVEKSPLFKLKVNTQNTSFIIVDGQHRAMAVLALYRQLHGWGEMKDFSPYYEHIGKPQVEDLENIELPVCIIFFPDIYEENSEVVKHGINLKKICREIFLVVNKSAKKVSKARELLLDDDDIAAHMMRKTLQEIKDESKLNNDYERIKIFSINYGDSEKEFKSGGKVYELTTAITLHKIHSAFAFTNETEFTLKQNPDVTDMRKVRFSERVVDMLSSKVHFPENLTVLSRESAKIFSPESLKIIVDNLCEASNYSVISLFNRFNFYKIHNKVLQQMYFNLNSERTASDPLWQNALKIFFDGSGVRKIFEQHKSRLEESQEEAKYGYNNDSKSKDTIDAQLKSCQKIQRHVEDWEMMFADKRAQNIFGFSDDFYEMNQEKKIEFKNKSNNLFRNAFATQAFQIGFIMLIHSLVGEVISEAKDGILQDYDERVVITKKITDIVIESINIYFPDESSKAYRSENGIYSEARINIFSLEDPGLRLLLKLGNKKEINEKDWVFFKYALLEILLSKYCLEFFVREFKDFFSKKYPGHEIVILDKIVDYVFSERAGYIEKAKDFQLESDDEYNEWVSQKKYKSENNLPIEDLEEKINQHLREVEKKIYRYIKASTGREIKDKDAMKKIINDCLCSVAKS